MTRTSGVISVTDAYEEIESFLDEEGYDYEEEQNNEEGCSFKVVTRGIPLRLWFKAEAQQYGFDMVKGGSKVRPSFDELSALFKGYIILYCVIFPTAKEIMAELEKRTGEKATYKQTQGSVNTGYKVMFQSGDIGYMVESIDEGIYTLTKRVEGEEDYVMYYTASESGVEYAGEENPMEKTSSVANDLFVDSSSEESGFETSEETGFEEAEAETISSEESGFEEPVSAPPVTEEVEVESISEPPATDEDDIFADADAEIARESESGTAEEDFDTAVEEKVWQELPVLNRLAEETGGKVTDGVLTIVKDKLYIEAVMSVDDKVFVQKLIYDEVLIPTVSDSIMFDADGLTGSDFLSQVESVSTDSINLLREIVTEYGVEFNDVHATIGGTAYALTSEGIQIDDVLIHTKEDYVRVHNIPTSDSEESVDEEEVIEESASDESVEETIEEVVEESEDEVAEEVASDESISEDEDTEESATEESTEEPVAEESTSEESVNEEEVIEESTTEEYKAVEEPSFIEVKASEEPTTESGVTADETVERGENDTMTVTKLMEDGNLVAIRFTSDTEIFDMSPELAEEAGLVLDRIVGTSRRFVHNGITISSEEHEMKMFSTAVSSLEEAKKLVISLF